MASIYTSAEWRTKPGREREFISLWQEFASWSKENFPEAVEAKLLQNREDPTLFVSVGQWRTEEVVQTWRKSQGFQERMTKLREMLEEVEIRALNAVAEV
jgi:heme-degrading monooxygenase HmoA